ncbi:hypothetical protein GH714_030466 [Hevea brasiliensis]|uniref:GAT domain-containing protein n=1 Tax=Hevea brasiliensis TaxID=3981 RepID=A0A6A6KDF9_HEVBR|nr:hypothetical protein GH714_030466 [Hevea brasiliensis]
MVWLQEDLTVSLLEKCKQSQIVIQRIIETTTDDEAMLFEALNLHDELQQVISQYEALEAGLNSGEQLPGGSDNTKDDLPAQPISKLLFIGPSGRVSFPLPSDCESVIAGVAF